MCSKPAVRATEEFGLMTSTFTTFPCSFRVTMMRLQLSKFVDKFRGAGSAK